MMLGFQSDQLQSEYALLVKNRTSFPATRASRKPERVKEGRGLLLHPKKGGVPGAR